MEEGKGVQDGEIASSGEVLWFDPVRGFGFIRDKKEQDDVFVHYSKIEGPMGQFRALNQGDKVDYIRFTVERGESKKIQAREVMVIEESITDTTPDEGFEK